MSAVIQRSAATAAARVHSSGTVRDRLRDRRTGRCGAAAAVDAEITAEVPTTAAATQAEIATARSVFREAKLAAHATPIAAHAPQATGAQTPFPRGADAARIPRAARGRSAATLSSGPSEATRPVTVMRVTCSWDRVRAGPLQPKESTPTLLPAI